MFILSVTQLVAKVFSTALLATTNPLWLIIWILADHTLHLIIKVARRDFFYFMRWTGIVKYWGSLLMRVFQKLTADFTGLILLRTPYGKTRATNLFDLCFFQF